MKYKVGDTVALKNKDWDSSYGFDDSTITKAWEKDGVVKYSIKSNKTSHTLSIVIEKELC
jgi:hypothetical protein